MNIPLRQARPSERNDPHIPRVRVQLLTSKNVVMVVIFLVLDILVRQMSSISFPSPTDIRRTDIFLPSSDPPKQYQSTDPPKQYQLPSWAFTVDPLFQAEYDRIDSVTPEERCAAFNLTPVPANPDGTFPPPRRLFLGSLIADDSWEIIKIHATEVYNVYHAIAFVESNTTFSNTPREMRYRGNTDPEMFLRSGAMFGNQTRLMLDYWMEDFPGLESLNREYEQTIPILRMWKEAGMTEEDVGVMSDLDEVVARDFLRALQVCDFPQFQPGQSCQYPKLCLDAMVWESSPMCRRKEGWFHPDVISGQCLEGIGDPTERIIPLRQFNRRYGERSVKYGLVNPNRYPPAVKRFERYPLWAGRDLRRGPPCRDNAKFGYLDRGDGEKSLRGPAYHLHNWFDDFHFLRNKYKTYGHPVEDAFQMPLSRITDLDTMVRCALNMGNNLNNTLGEDYYYSEERRAIQELEGNQPIYFVNKTYVMTRHSYLSQLVAEDVKQHGLGYPE